MALQQAQLGYMPTLSTPSGGGRYVKPRSPWEDLAIGIASQLATQGVTNVMSPDFTESAQAEGLPVDATMEAAPWWKKVVTGPTTTRGQLDQLRGQKNQSNIAMAGEAGATKRHNEQIDFQRGEGIANRQATVDQRALDRLFQSSEAEKAREFTGTQAGLDRDLRASEGAANRTASMAEVEARIGAAERELGRRLTADERNNLIQSIVSQLGKISMSSNPLVTNMVNSNLKPGQAPLPTPDEQAAQFMEMLKRQGLIPADQIYIR